MGGVTNLRRDMNAHPTVISTCPVSTLSFALTAMLVTLPANFARTSVFIFIASIVATLSPMATSRPSGTSMEFTTPPNGATTLPAPATAGERA